MPINKKPQHFFGITIATVDETNLVKTAAEAGEKAFRDGGSLSENPFSPLKEQLMYNAWATGWRGRLISDSLRK